MAVQKIPFDILQKLRQQIQSALTLPRAEMQPKPWSAYTDADELPEPESLGELSNLFNYGGTIEEVTHAPNNQGHWFISSTNPGDVLYKLPGLKLKPDYRLVSYLYRAAENGVGATWALPQPLSTTAELEKALIDSDRDHPPKPAGALDQVMLALEGDRSIISFVAASLLRRELQEFGALGNGCSWSRHRLIQTVPPQLRWQWRVEPPKSMAPKVLVYADGRAAIEFFTCRTVAPIALFQHLDQYSAEHYQANSLNRAIAIAQGRS